MEVDALLQTQRTCPHCGYDLRSQTQDDPAATVTCPECGNSAPPPTKRVYAEPGTIWHVMMSTAFGLPLVLTAFEAAEEMVIHKSGGAAYASGDLTFLVFAGGVVVFAGWIRAIGRTRNKERMVYFGAMYFFMYCVVLVLLSQWIDWLPYMV